MSLAAIGAFVALGLSDRRRGSRAPASATGPAMSPAGSAGGDAHGRDATTPIAIPARGWRDIALRTWEQIGLDRVLAVAAGVTFYCLLGLFPAITALVSIYGLFADRATVVSHLDLLADFIPDGAIDIIGEQMTRIATQPADALGLGFFIGLAIALWSANQGMKAIFDALNVAYGETEKRGFLKLNAISLGFTLAAIGFVLAAMGAIVVWPIAVDFLRLDGWLKTTINFMRWPALALALIIAVGILYRVGPSRTPARWRWITPGAALATIVWIAASIGFSWYVANFGSYNETYGSLGAVIGFMTWIWVSASIILVGAELNAEMEHQTRRDSTIGPEKPLGTRGAAMADRVAPIPE